ncbi:NAD(P)-dependent oxidoreductase [Actinomadura logoneensis]|uniref:NAD(P)-dependent oxidoreductase n=1 Tax=Actinomadura logoneensis TaxID=2293572 RepID=A0A372JLZ0_9ACTN|nr:NAD(P)-binding domain-containing protein [Actinomadura logoneensis]RFU40836.1 NAD(P)-dependent oxidoreductase [Actinomadura logoneensis]
MDNHNRTPVTVLGLGLMGRALASAFLRAGHPTTVWNRTASKAEGLVAEGATAAGSVADAVAASPLVVVCLTDHAAVRDVLDATGGWDGRVLVNLTSGTARDAGDLAAWAERQGAAYLDGAIMAAPDVIGGDATIVYSGPRAVYDAQAATLLSLGSGARHLGEDPTLTALHETAALSLMWNMLNGFLHGVALLKAAGVDASSFAPLAVQGVETVAAWLPGYARQVDDGEYPGLDSSLNTHVAAMRHLVETSEALGVSAELPKLIEDIAGRAVAEGRGGEGYAVLVEQFAKP